MADDKKKEATDAKDKSEKTKVEAPAAKKDDGNHWNVKGRICIVTCIPRPSSEEKFQSGVGDVCDVERDCGRGGGGCRRGA